MLFVNEDERRAWKELVNDKLEYDPQFKDWAQLVCAKLIMSKEDFEKWLAEKYGKKHE